MAQPTLTEIVCGLKEAVPGTSPSAMLMTSIREIEINQSTTADQASLTIYTDGGEEYEATIRRVCE